MIQPIGLTVIGGLVSSTFITLFFIPVLYSLINEKRGKKRNQKRTAITAAAVRAPETAVEGGAQ
jgi:predicted RND superfamily exporter protein